MKKIMKKNQVIITSLAILIAVAGYLNFADVDLGFKDKETSTDSSSILDDVDYDLTDETALLDENGADGTTQSEVMDTASPGEAVLTGASDFAAQAKVSREQVRSQNKTDLQTIISNKDISDEEKQNSKTAEDQNAEKTRLESRLEELLSNVEGVGEVEVIIMTGDEGNTENFSISSKNEVTGVLVAAQGAGSAVTVQNIQQAIMALFQIDANKIRIMKMK